MINIGLIGANKKYFSFFKNLQEVDIFKISLIFSQSHDRNLKDFAQENNIYLTDKFEDVFLDKFKIRLLVDTLGNKDIIHKFLDMKPEAMSIIDVSMLTLLTESIKQKLQLEKRIMMFQKYETIGTLVSGICHEINNILMIIMGYAQLASAKSPNNISQYISGIIESCQRASKLIQQLSSFRTQEKIEKRKVNIVPLIKETVKFIKETFPENIKITLNISPDIHEVEADLVNLRHAILNLASNSQEAMPEGGEIEISLFNEHLDENFCKEYPFVSTGDYVCISFKDTGIGIPKEFLNRIFEPFFTTKDLGRGLGLSYVYGIIKQHNGYIVVNSEQNKGAEFKIYIPAINKKEEEDKEIHGVQEAEGTILMVEDEKDLLNIAAEFLKKMGYAVLTADNGEKAFDIISDKGKNINLVITDLILPDSFGSRIAYMAKKKNPDIRTILITGYKNHIDESISDELFDIITHKPISMADLANKVYKLIKK